MLENDVQSAKKKGIWISLKLLARYIDESIEISLFIEAFEEDKETKVLNLGAFNDP